MCVCGGGKWYGDIRLLPDKRAREVFARTYNRFYKILVGVDKAAT